MRREHREIAGERTYSYIRSIHKNLCGGDSDVRLPDGPCVAGGRACRKAQPVREFPQNFERDGEGNVPTDATAYAGRHGHEHVPEMKAGF